MHLELKRLLFCFHSRLCWNVNSIYLLWSLSWACIARQMGPVVCMQGLEAEDASSLSMAIGTVGKTTGPKIVPT